MSASDLPKTSFTSTGKSSESFTEKLSAVTNVDVTELKRPAMHSNHDDVAEKPASKSESTYLHQLKSLNESVTKWIKQHVDKNPYCILSPIFKDYETYLSDLEKKYPSHSTIMPSDTDESSRDTSANEMKEATSSPTPASSVLSTGNPKF